MKTFKDLKFSNDPSNMWGMMPKELAIIKFDNGYTLDIDTFYSVINRPDFVKEYSILIFDKDKNRVWSLTDDIKDRHKLYGLTPEQVTDVMCIVQSWN